MSRMPRLAPLALCLAAAPVFAETPPAVDAKPAKREQMVIVSFDGAHDNALWEKSLDMGQRTGAHFTYFLSCTFLMTKAGDGRSYQAPGHKAGRSNVGFAQSNDEIAARARHIWQAHLAGHDIGSHACGHFDGAKWSAEERAQEFDFFRNTLRDAWTNASAWALRLAIFAAMVCVRRWILLTVMTISTRLILNVNAGRLAH